jgi:hypothetical protein
MASFGCSHTHTHATSNKQVFHCTSCSDAEAEGSTSERFRSKQREYCYDR